jgi:uncharacterized protein (DUF305 family)
VRAIRAAAAIAAILAIPAAAIADDMGNMKGMSMSPTDGKADAAYKASMTKMMSDMDAKPTGDADKDFVSMMMPHHQGAIDMAKVELKYGKDPVLRKMADDIVKAQEKEIGEMKSWQAKNGK